MAQILVLGAPDEGCAGKHGRSIPLADHRVEGHVPEWREMPPTSRFCSVRPGKRLRIGSRGALPSEWKALTAFVLVLMCRKEALP